MNSGPDTAGASGPMSDTELARLRRKVDSGEPLTLDTESGALLAEMQRATAVIKPAADTLNAAVRAAQTRAGRELDYDELTSLWESDPGLRSVKALYDRERARWRRANGILRESNLLLRGEALPDERRAPHPVEPGIAPELDRRRPPKRRRPWQRASAPR